MSRQIDAGGVPSGKASTENKKQFIDTLTRALLERDMPEAKNIFDRLRKVEESTIAWSAHRQLCQRVTELERQVDAFRAEIQLLRDLLGEFQHETFFKVGSRRTES